MIEIRIDLLIRSMIEGTAPVMSLLTFVALLFMASVNVRSKNRLRFLGGIVSSMRSERSKAYRVQRATDFLDTVLLRSYYVVGLISVGALCLLPYLRMDPHTWALLWASFGGLAFISPGIFYLNFRDRDPDSESNTRKRLYEAAVLGTGPQILEMYDKVSGLYTKDFWLKALELRVRRRFHRYAPITCVLLELPELNAIRRQHGDSAADEVVRQFASDLRNNAGGEDLCARIGYNRFAVAAMRCPADTASSTGQRIAHNASRVTVVGDGEPLMFVLRIRWLSATSPAYAAIPSRLLHTAITSMDRETQRPPGVLVAQPLPSQRAAA